MATIIMRSDLASFLYKASRTRQQVNHIRVFPRGIGIDIKRPAGFYQTEAKILPEKILTEEKKDIGEQMAAMAEQHVSASKERLGLDYDYSGQSLQVVDQALAHFHPDGFSFDMMMHVFGAYVGETVRKLHGGTWHKEDDGTGASLRGVEGKATIYPLIWTAQRVDALKSKMGGSEIAGQYAALLESLDLADKIPAAIAADHVATVQGGNLFGGSGPSDADANSDAAAVSGSDSDPDTDVEETEELTAEEKAEALAMAPASCFFLVAAIDGNIDKKEVKAFVKDLGEQANHSNELIKTVFQAAPARFDSDVSQITELGAGALLMLPLKLITARAYAQEIAPEMADEFCQTLYDMAVKIASASGGFLGFGSKIGKEEKAALELLNTVLIESKED